MQTISFRWLVKEVDVRNSIGLDYPLMSVSQSKGVIPRADLMGNDGRAESLDNYKICLPGQIVINRMSASSGSLGLARQAGLVSPDYAVLAPTKLVDPKYLEFLMRSTWFIGEMVARLKGIGAGGESASVRTPRINISDLRDVLVTLPPIDEQRMMADYLGAEIEVIDNVMRTTSLLISKNAERLQSKISYHFLNNQFNRIPIRYLCRNVSDKFVGSLPTLSLDLVNSRKGTLNCDELPITEGDTATSMRKGDVAFGKLRPYLGKVFLATDKIYAESEFIVMRPDSEKLMGAYLRDFLLASDTLQTLESKSIGAKMPRTSWEDIASLNIPMPDLKSQRAMMVEIENLRATAERLEHMGKMMMSSMSELKSSLITTVITGQLDSTFRRSIA